MSKSLRLLFVASVILNVLFAGVFVGHLPQRSDGSRSRQQRIEHFIASLPASAREPFREKLKENEPTRNRIREGRKEAIAILGAEPFDENTYDRQIGQIPCPADPGHGEACRHTGEQQALFPGPALLPAV